MLSDVAIRKAAIQERDYKIHDAFGLYLLIKTTGSKLWRFDYRFDGKRRTASLGRYPGLGLADARRSRDVMRDILQRKLDPMAEMKRKAEVAAADKVDTFEKVSKEYIAYLIHQNRAPATIKKANWMLLGLVPETIRSKPIRSVSSKDILDALLSVYNSGREETARKMRTHIGSVFRFAMPNLKVDFDPTFILQKNILHHKATPMAAIVDEREFGILMTAIDGSSGWWSVRLYLKFLALTFVRPGEARFARWSEFDIDAKVWTIPKERMKMRIEHKVPLSKQAVAVLDEAREMDHRTKLVFPSLRSNLKELSENAANSSLRRLGFPGDKMVSHGFRSSASTMLNRRKFDKEVIEVQLSHAPEDRIRAIYNRDEMWAERVKLMQRWADMTEDMRIL